MKNIEILKNKQGFGQLIAGTDFEDYAINNKFINDNKNFIEKKSGSAKFSFAFIFQNETFGVWTDNKNSRIYISYDYYHNTPFLFATTIDDHNMNTLFLNQAKKYSCWKHLIDNYNLGNVRFENMKIKNITMKLLKNIILK